jgi:hypothetical protein
MRLSSVVGAFMSPTNLAELTVLAAVNEGEVVVTTSLNESCIEQAALTGHRTNEVPGPRDPAHDSRELTALNLAISSRGYADQLVAFRDQLIKSPGFQFGCLSICHDWNLSA